jgi:hypothetical protein
MGVESFVRPLFIPEHILMESSTLTLVLKECNLQMPVILNSFVN